MSNSSPAISTANLAFVESLYGRFLEDPNSVPGDPPVLLQSEHPADAGVRIGPSFTARSLLHAPLCAHKRLDKASPETAGAAANGSYGAQPVTARNGSGAGGSVSGGSVSWRALPATVTALTATVRTRSERRPRQRGHRASRSRTLAPSRISRSPRPRAPRRWRSAKDRVDQLVRAFRVRGHMIAKVDPLSLPRPHYEELDPSITA